MPVNARQPARWQKAERGELVHKARAPVSLQKQQPAHKTRQGGAEESRAVARDRCVSDVLELAELKLFRHCNIFLMRLRVINEASWRVYSILPGILIKKRE